MNDNELSARISAGEDYQYGPFGELLRATGPMAKANPFRFSTKYQDDETDLLYYGYRCYNASTGRSLSRDPKGERVGGSESLYGFAANSLVNACDPLGLSPLWYTLQVDPSQSEDPSHVGFYPNAIFLPVTYPKEGAKCSCRGQL